MEIKYTIEILTKDIQDIEKLVGNLRNSDEASSIELDLAMAKLRNVYEILTMIKSDRYHELFSQAMGTSSPGSDKVTAADVEEQDQPAPPEPEAPQKPEPQQVTEADPPLETQTEPPRAQEAEPPQATETEKPQAAESEPLPDAGADTDPPAVQEEGGKPKPEPAVKTEKKEHSILAEKFTAESSINENLAGKLGNGKDAKLVGKPIDNISRNIGINDRFLIIRELFDGDADRFTNLVNALDNAENFPAASGILKDQFAGIMDHEGVQILSGLLKRRFIR
jgi:hypothetical protein